MNTNHLIALLQSNCHTIGVHFKDSRTGAPTEKEYTYKRPDSMELEVGDEVIVESPYGVMVVVVVSRLDGYAAIDPSREYTYKWVVQKVEAAAYHARQEAEKEAFAAFRKARRLAARDKAMKEIMATLEGSTEALDEFNGIVKKLSATV
jgi:cell fate regulator YaaT (PSP1 superfamily)